THTYLIAGTLTYTVNFVDVGGTAGQVTGTATVPVADLMLTKTGPPTADANTDVVYHLVVTNDGPLAAQNVHLLDPVPAGMTFVAQGYDPGDPVPSVCNFGATIDCSTGVLALAATFGVTLTFHVNQADADGMVITNTASATSDTFDPNPANNSASVRTTVVNAADLAVSKTGPPTADANTNVVYHLVVTNDGPLAAQNVHLLDPVPAGMTFGVQGYDPGDPVPSVCNFGATIDCSTGVLALAATFGVTLTFHVNQADADGMVITNPASATSDTFDPNPANNSASVRTTVVNAADLAVSKTG